MNSTARGEELRLLPAPFRDWEAGEVFEAVVELGHALNPNSRGRGIKSGDFTEFSDQDLVRGYRFVRAWPEGMERIVRNATQTDHGSIGKLFGPLRKYLDPQASQSHLCDLIRSAAPAILRKLEIVPTSPRSGRLLGNFPPDLGDTINARAASELYRVDLKVLRRLERGGQSFVTKGGWREGTTLYRADVLREAVERFHAAARIDECAKLLGVPQFVVPALVEANLLAPETNHDANLLAAGHLIVDRSSITSLIKAARHRRTDASAGTPLSSAMVGRFHPASWVEVLRLLIDATIAVVGVAGSELALFDRLLVEPSEVDRALGQSEPSIPAGLRVSCVGAAKLLGVSNVLVNGAFYAGLLPGWQIGRGDVRLEVADVATFAEEFVTPAEGSRLLELSGKGFHARMTTLGFQPAGQARKFTLWLRSDVEAALALQSQSPPQPARRPSRKSPMRKGETVAPRQVEARPVKQARA